VSLYLEPDGPDAGEGIESWEILDLLSALVERSLVIPDQESGRFRLLETVREYGRGKLADLADAGPCRGRHLDYFTGLCEFADQNITGPEQQRWLNCLESEHDNIRAALDFSIGSRHAEAFRPSQGLRIAGTAWRFWQVRGHISEGRLWLSRALSAEDGDSPADPDQASAARARALTGAGALAVGQGDFAAARAHHEKSLVIHRAAGNPRGISRALGNLGIVCRYEGDYAAAEAQLGESLAILRKMDDRHGIASALINLGSLAFDQADYASAKQLFEESLKHFRDLGDRRSIAVLLQWLGTVASSQGDFNAGRDLLQQALVIFRELGGAQSVSYALHNLGQAAFDQKDPRAARAHFCESLEISRKIGDRALIADTLTRIAAIDSLSMPLRAASTWGAVERLREESRAQIPPKDVEGYHACVAAARAAHNDDAAFDRVWNEGRERPLDESITLALEELREAGRSP
jgi:tetratricopeptide (TPR) repeat protein